MHVLCEDNNILCEFQSGFRKYVFTSTNIFTSMTISYLLLLCLKMCSAYSIFTGFRIDLDAINHKILWNQLYVNGIFRIIIRSIQSLYRYATLQIKIYTGIYNSIVFTPGVLRGSFESAVICLIHKRFRNLFMRNKLKRAKSWRL